MQFDDVEIVSERALGHTLFGGFHDFTLVVEIAVRPDALEIVCGGVIDDAWVFVLSSQQESLLLIDEFLVEGGDRLGRWSLRKSQGHANQNRAQQKKIASHHCLQESFTLCFPVFPPCPRKHRVKLSWRPPQMISSSETTRRRDR